LGVTIPKQALNLELETPLNVNSITSWRAKLPMADMGASAKKVFELLQEFNQTALAAKDRYEILELIRPPIQYICQGLKKHYFNQTQALNEKKLMVVTLAKTLQTEMAYGYKLIIEEVINSGNTDKSLLASAIQRTLHYFTHILIRTFQLYSAPPQGLWQEIFILYTLAEKHEILNELVNIGLSQQPIILSTIFKQIFLLAASDPYKWRQTELEALYNALIGWATLLEILPFNTDQSAGLFKIDLNSDEPPIAASLSNSVTDHGRLLNVIPIIPKLKELQNRLETAGDENIGQGSEYIIPLPILKTLIKDWNTVQKRNIHRYPGSISILLSVGLSSTHYHLSGQEIFPPKIKVKDKTPSSALSLEASTTLDQEVNEDIDFSDIGHAKDDKSAIFPLHKGSIENTSEHGVCIIWQGVAHPAIQTGEILGIQNTDTKNWQIATIRWIRHLQNNVLKIGVEIHQGTIQAAAGQMFKDEKPIGYFLRCFVVTLSDATNPSILIAPTLPFKLNSQIFIVLAQNKGQIEVTLNELLDATGTYKKFGFKQKFTAQNDNSLSTNSGDGPTTPDKVTQKPSGGTFDSIWDSL
ncbi:MAG: GTPase, partial [Francisellaceae bacterium]|nr:GTPase [Francisellaceae bacterium]